MNWSDFFKTVNIGDVWPPTKDNIKKQLYPLIATWVAGGSKTLEQAIKDALSDDKLTQPEMIGILVAVAQSRSDDKLLGSQFMKDLLDGLKDATLTPDEIAGVVASWVAGQVKDATLKQLIKAASDGHLSRDEVEEALLGWLNTHGGPSVATKLRKLLDSPQPVNLRAVIVLVTSFLIDAREITGAGSTIDKQIKDLVDTLGHLGNSALVDILAALAEKDYVKAARLTLKELDVDVADTIIAAAVHGKVEELGTELLQRILSKSIEGITKDQAIALAARIVDIVNGKEQLVPLEDEQQRLKLGDLQYALWLRVKRLLYAVKLAVKKDPLVSTDPQAQPHVFAAAAIAFDMKLVSLSKGQTAADLEDLRKLIWSFTYEEFKDDPGGYKYKTDAPFYTDSLKTATAEDLFDDVAAKLR